MAIAVAVFLVVAVVVFGSYWVFVVTPEQRDQGALKARLTKAQRREAGRGHLSLEKEAGKFSAIRPLNALLGATSLIANPTQRLLDQAGVKLRVGALFLACACLGVLVYWITSYLTGFAMAGLALGLLAATFPVQWVRWKRSRRMLSFEEQFPEAIDLIARALRAGHAFTTGLQMVAEEMPDPIGTEFRLLYDRQNFGQPLPEALRDFAARVPLIDARFFATAVLTQREAGGNLSEVLDNLAEVIRERFKVKRQVRVLSAHGRITGWILMGLPPSLAVAFLIVAPQNMKLLVDDPLGVQMIVGAIVLQLVGSLIIRKLVNIEY